MLRIVSSTLSDTWRRTNHSKRSFVVFINICGLTDFSFSSFGMRERCFVITIRFVSGVGKQMIRLILRLSETTLDYANQLSRVSYSIYELKSDGTYSSLS